MFAIMFTSAMWALGSGSEVANSSRQVNLQKDVGHPTTETQQFVYNLAMQQFLLALYTITTAHVQIISRISSAFPVWLWYCAHLLHSKDTRFVSNFVRFMVIYAVIQAGLYASFLPPA
jgi:phosphatidylinositol glycan class V